MFPYERVVALLAGPLATLIGVGATALVHQNITHTAAVNVATFVLSSAATYLAHHKWLDNLAKWWQHQTDATTSLSLLTGHPDTPGEVVLAGKPETAVHPDGPASAVQ